MTTKGPQLKGPVLAADEKAAQKAAKVVREFWKELPESSVQKTYIRELGQRVEIDEFIVSSSTAVSSGSSIAGNVAVAVSISDSGDWKSLTVPGYFVVKLDRSGSPEKSKTKIEFIDIANAGA